MRITKENIWNEIKEKNNYLEVLESDLVDKIKDEDGWTPLHLLAYRGVKDVLHHPSVDKVKDKYDDTPLHLLANYRYIIEKDLIKRFPWYKKEIKSVYKAVEEIVNTPRSIQFILED